MLAFHQNFSNLRYLDVKILSQIFMFVFLISKFLQKMIMHIIQYESILDTCDNIHQKFFKSAEDFSDLNFGLKKEKKKN